MKHLGETIAERRRALGYTQEKLGELLSVSGQAVSKWECSESLPDITLLPALCHVLSISSDTLLDIPKQEQDTDILQDFCAFARRSGRTGTLLDALSRLYNDVGANANGENHLIAPDQLRLYDGAGMGFLMKGRYRERLNDRPAEDIQYFLRPLTDVLTLSIFRRLSFDTATTAEELSAELGADETVVKVVLLGLMKRSIICCDTDNGGKRGYLLDHAAAGVYMILAGCEAANCGGEVSGNLWFTRNRFTDGEREDQ